MAGSLWNTMFILPILFVLHFVLLASAVPRPTWMFGQTRIKAVYRPQLLPIRSVRKEARRELTPFVRNLVVAAVYLRASQFWDVARHRSVICVATLNSAVLGHFLLVLLCSCMWSGALSSVGNMLTLVRSGDVRLCLDYLHYLPVCDVAAPPRR
jgi:hypothetical protein